MRKVPQNKRAGILVLLALLLVVFSYGYFRLFSISVRGLINEFSSLVSEESDQSQTEKPKTVAFGNPEARHDNLGSVKGVTSESSGQVRAVEDNITENSLVFRLRVFFLDAIEAASARFDTDVEVGNDLTVGNDLSIGNDVVLDNDLDVGADITVAGTTVITGDLTAPNVIYSLLAGDGIAVSGDQDITITNDDTGSAQNIFKNIKVGSTTISADANDDTFTLEGGSGVSLSNSGKTITIAASGSDLNVSGWFDDGTAVRLVSSTDNVGIGTSSPGYKLHVVGDSYFSGVATFASGTIVSSGINNSSGGITNAGSITGATGFTSTGTITFPDFSIGVLQTNVNGVVSSSPVFLGPGSTVISGVLPVTNGGTGLSSLNTGDILYASASSTLARLGAGSDGEVLTISGGVPAWGTAGGSGPCATCLVNNPNSTQTITPAAATATGLVVKQANSGSVDSFRVESFDGSSVYFRIDSSGNVALGDNTTSGTFTVSPASTDPITIDPVAQGVGSYEGTITSLDLTAARTWQFPDLGGVVCLSTGNCAGTSASIGGSGTTNYLTKWSDTYNVTTSIVYDDGNNVGIGTTTMGSLLDVAGTLNVDGLATFGGDVNVAKHATISGSLRVDQMVDLNSTLGVSGAATFGNTLDVTGLATFNGNVGIGTSVPTEKFQVYGTSVPKILLYASDTSVPELKIDNNTAAGSGSLILGENKIELFTQGNTGYFNANTNQSIPFEFRHSGVNIASYNHLGWYFNTGNVGIGTTSPVSKLNINSGRITVGASDIGNVTTGVSVYGTTHGETYGYQVGQTASNNIIFGWVADNVNSSGYGYVGTFAGNNDLFLQRSGGNVGIGISSTAPSQKLDVKGGIRLGADNVNNVLNTSAAGASPTGLLYWGDRSICDSSGNCSGTAAGVGGSGTTNYVTKWSGTYSMTDSIIYDDGTNVGIGTTAPIHSLDVRSSDQTGTAINAITNITTGTTSAYSIVGSSVVTSSSLLGYATGVHGNLSYGGSGGISNASAGRFTALITGSAPATANISGILVTSLSNNSASSVTGVNVQSWGKSGAGSISNVYGLNLGNISNGGTITNTYGLYIGDITTGTQTNTPYSIYASDVNARSYFAGNVGIGTTSPAATLEVISSATSLPGLSVKGIGSQTANIFQVKSSDGVRDLFSVDPDGNAIIDQIGANFYFAGGAGPHTIKIDTADPGSTGENLFIQAGNAGAGLGSYNGGNLYLDPGNKNNSGTIGNILLATQNAGNVGIGTTSPGYKLDVAGELNLTDAIRVAGDAGTSGYFLTSAAGAANTWTEPASVYEAGWFTNTSNVLHAKNEYASVVDLVIGGTSTASADIQLFSNGGAVFNEQSNNASFRVESDNKTHAFFVNGSNGSIGIGTSSPDAKFHLYDSVNSVTGIGIQNPNAGTAASSYFSVGNDTVNSPWDALYVEHYGTNYTPNGLRQPSSSTITEGGSGGLSIGTDNSSSLNFFTSGVANGADVTLHSSGNFGIGSTAPAYKFEVNGTAAAALFRSNNDGFELSSGAGGTARLGVGSGSNFVGSTSTNDFSIRTDNIDRIYINSAGRVGIGTTVPTGLLHVNGAVTGKALTILNETGNQAIFTASASGTTRFVILNNGNVGIGTNAPSQVLDVNGNVRVRGNNISDSAGTNRIGLGATTTLTNTTTTLSGTTTLTASSLATLTTAANVNWSGATGLTFTADNAVIYGSDVANGNITLHGTSNATRTTSSIFLQPSGGNVGIGKSSTFAKLDLEGDLRVFGAATASASYASGKALVIRGAASQTGNLTEWQDSSGGLMTAITANGYLDFASSPTPNTFNNIIRFNNWIVGESEIAGGFANGVISLSGGNRTFLNLITDNSTNSLFSGGISAEGYRRFAMTGSGTWQVGGGSSTYDTTLERNSGGPGWLMTSTYNGSSNLTLKNTRSDITSTSSLLDLQLTDDNDQDGNFMRILNSGGSPMAVWQAHGSGFPRLGINTSSPADTVHIKISGDVTTSMLITNEGSGSGAQAAYVLDNDVGANSLAYFGLGGSGTTTGVTNSRAYLRTDATLNGISLITEGSGDDIRFFTGGTSLSELRAIIDGAGNVGIGTTSPGESVHTTGNILLENDKYLKAKVTGGTAYNLIGVTTGDNVYVGDPNFNRISFDANGRQVFNINGSEVMRIDGAGNIGIGSNTPVGKLNVNGSLTGKALAIFNETGDQNIFTASASGTTRFVIQNNGNVGIGTTATNTRLDIRSSSAADTMVSIWGDNSGYASGLFIKSGASSADWKILTQQDYLNNALLFGTGAPYSMVLTTGGQLGLGNTSPTGLLDVSGAVTGKALAILNETGDQDILVASVSGSRRFSVGNTGAVSITNDYDQTGTIFTSGYGVGSGWFEFQIGGTNGDIALFKDCCNTVFSVSNTDGTSSFNYNLNVDGDFTVDTNTLIVNSTSNNVGIGSGTPAAKLDVAGNIGVGVYPNGRVYNNGDSDTYLEFGNNKTRLQAGGAPSIEISSTSFHGNWANQTDMDFSWDGDFNDGVLFVDTSAETVGIGTNTPVSKLDVQGAVTGKALAIFNETGDQNILTASASGITVFTIERGGDVIIDNNIEGRRALMGNGNSSGPSFSFINDGNSGMFSATADELGFATGASEQMRIDNNGNVGIGSTDPGIKLDVVGSARFSAVGSGTYSNDLNLTSDGTLTTSSSDIRLKKDLISMNDAEILSKVLQLQTYSFRWKQDGSTDIGMVAQEVDGIFPELTFTNKTDGYMGINYSRLPTLLVSALQEQQRQLQNLQIKLDESGAVTLALEEQVLGVAAQEAPSAQEQLREFLRFADVIEVLKGTIFKARAQFLATVEFMEEVRFRGAVRFNADTVGRFTLPAGATRLKITFDSEFSQAPTVFLSAQQTVVGGSKVESVTKSDFIVTLTQAQNQAVVFDWLAVLSDAQGDTRVEVLESSDGGAVDPTVNSVVQDQEQVSEPSPEPTISPEVGIEESNSVATQSSQINTVSNTSTATESGTLD